jgi:hypothetical protein
MFSRGGDNTESDPGRFIQDELWRFGEGRKGNVHPRQRI